MDDVAPVLDMLRNLQVPSMGNAAAQEQLKSDTQAKATTNTSPIDDGATGSGGQAAAVSDADKAKVNEALEPILRALGSVKGVGKS